MLALACFGLFWLALAALAACAFRSIATQVLPLLTLLDAFFFELNSYIDFRSIFSRFWRVLDGFWESLGPSRWSKNRVLGVFQGILFEAMFLVDF